MMRLLKTLVCSKKRKIEDLEKENMELRMKLDKRQEDINKTNAYWKKKFNLLKHSKNQ